MNFDPLSNYVPLWLRLSLGVAVLSIMAWADWKKNGAKATRYKEYFFLVVSAVVAIAFAEVHDFITVRISPEYFIEGKGLGPQDLHWNVAKLAVRASYWMGLLLGLLFLIANNPFRGWPRLPYSTLYKLMGMPIIGALLMAPVFGAYFRQTESLEPNFALVWGIHNGTYFGAALGAVIAIVMIVRLRLKRRSVSG